MEMPDSNNPLSSTPQQPEPQSLPQQPIPQQLAQYQVHVPQQPPLPYASQPVYMQNPYVLPILSPQAIARQHTITQIMQPQNLRIAVFAFLFSYFYAESVFSYNIQGIGVTISTIIFCLFTYFTFYKNAPQKNTTALLLYCPIFVISIGFGLHFNPMSHLIMSATMFVLLGIQLILFVRPAMKDAFSPAMLRLFFTHIIRKPLSYLTIPFKTLKFFKTVKSSAFKKILIIFLGLAVAVPACALLLMWFTSADAGFSAMFDDFMDFLQEYIELDVLKIFLNIFFAITIGAVLGAILLLNSLKVEEESAEKQAAQKKTVSTLFLSTFLCAVTAVIVLFVATQFRYFFFGDANGTITKIGYAEYARRGFFELTYASAFIFIMIVLIFTFCKKRENGSFPRIIQALVGIVCASNIVILVSAVMRMSLYIQVYGYSMKRLMTLWFMPILGICTLLLLIKCFAARFNALKYAGITVVVAVCLLSVSNTDRIVAKQRVDRYLETGDEQYFDMDYFYQLSYSSLPEIERCYNQMPAFKSQACLSQHQGKLERYKAKKLEEMETKKSQDSIFAFTLDRLWIED